MRNPAIEIIPSYRKACGMRQRINAAAMKIPELNCTKAADCISEKGVTSSFFYAQTFASAGIGLPIDLDRMNEIASSIIITDEIVEQGTDISQQRCLQASLEVMGHADFQEKNPLAYKELEKMHEAMDAEYQLSTDRINQKPGQVGFYDKYAANASKSFGMMPLFAMVAEENGEQDRFKNQYQYHLLEGIEEASRILADIITVGKDLRSGADNMVTVLQAELTGQNFNMAVSFLADRATVLINSLRSHIDYEEQYGSGVPTHLRFALNFAEVLEATAGIEDSQNGQKSKALKLMGQIIQKGIFPIPNS